MTSRPGTTAVPSADHPITRQPPPDQRPRTPERQHRTSAPIAHSRRQNGITDTDTSRWIAGVRRDSSWAVSVVVLATSEHSRRTDIDRAVTPRASVQDSTDASATGWDVVGTAIEAPDASALASFYSQLLGWAVVHEEPGTAVVAAPEGAIYIVFQQTSDYQRPVWPPQDGRQRPMMHFDFQVAELTPPSPKHSPSARPLPIINRRKTFACCSISLDIRSAYASTRSERAGAAPVASCRYLPRAGADRFRAIPQLLSAGVHTGIRLATPDARTARTRRSTNWVSRWDSFSTGSQRR